MPYDITKTASEIENVDWSTGTGSGQHYTTVRFGSGSSQASQSSGDICRICHCESDPKNPLLTPCYCAGSLKYVHQACLQQWLTASETNSCELCKFPFIMHTKIKPFNEWRSLDISGVERRRLCCSVLFHCAAALCVIWSLCVLIERAADDVKRGLIDWPFWTKLAVVTVGLTGGVVFMYIQCKAYLHLCHRWKARNRILLIQNAPEKVHPLSHPSPGSQQQQQQEQPNNRCQVFQDPRSTSSINANANAAIADCMGVNSASMPSESARRCGGNSELDGAGVAPHNTVPRLPHHTFQQADSDMTAAVRILAIAEGGGDDSIASSQPGQIVANIECSQSQQNYERDWALDDVVSQISSFQPCPQGSGSMTPFHDSIHNALEHSQSSSHGSVTDVCGGGSRQDLSTGEVSSDTGREHAMQLSSHSGTGLHKEPSMSSDVSSAVANGLGSFVYKPQFKRYSNSSIFLENRDILNDSAMLGIESDGSGGVGVDAYPKLNYRHSCVLTASNIDADNLEKFLGKDLRRYSDTKLLASDSDLLDPMIFKNPADPVTNVPPSRPPANAIQQQQQQQQQKRRRQQFTKQHSAADAPTILDMELPKSPLTSLSHTFDGSSHSHRKPAPTLCRSMQTVDASVTAATAAGGLLGGLPPSSERATEQQMDKARLFFKSLPNLSSSCESLI